ncbi:MAG TPA: hypothetical protein VFZ85_01975 [Jiangellaceae bacterium]
MPKTTADPRPLYAVAGVADLAVAALRELTARLPVLAERAENAAVSARDRLADRIGELPAELDKLRAELPTDVQKLRHELPAEFDKLRAELPTDVQKLRNELPSVLTDLQAKAQKYYGELATRGEGAVARFRREHADTIEAVGTKVADTAEKVADAADEVAEDLTEATAAKPAPQPAANKPAAKKPAAKKPAKKAASTRARKPAAS